MKYVEIFTQQDAIMSFHKELKRVYHNDRKWKSCISHSSGKMKRLYNISEKFNDKTTKDEARSVLGTFASWIDIECDLCNKIVDRVVRLGYDSEYDCHKIEICEKCLNKINEDYQE